MMHDGILSMFKNKHILVTGHTGFKGSWLCVLLMKLGSQVYGYGLKPYTSPALFDMLDLFGKMNSIIGDIRDLPNLQKAFDEAKPEIVFHLAAQPIVRKGYEEPVDTYSTNVMGTVNVLECARRTPSVRSFLNVTTDKVYQNQDWEWPYRESDPLNGFDPYSNSKSCSELVTDCYRKSFLLAGNVAVSTTRAGNVIGGGDFSDCRIIPDCVRAACAHQDIIVRNPDSVRPYQHLLDALYAYLLIAAGQFHNPSLAGAYNIGPEDSDFLRTSELAGLFVKAWGKDARWLARSNGGPHEDKVLKVDCSKMKKNFCWRPVWNTEVAVSKTVEWYRCWDEGGDVRACMDAQINDFFSEVEQHGR